jgi:hypothetical protein
MSEEPSPFKGMPSWPEEAKDLPEDPKTKEQYFLLYILGAVGGLIGAPLGFIASRGDELLTFVHIVVLGLAGLSAGFILDRRRWNIARQARK